VIEIQSESLFSSPNERTETRDEVMTKARDTQKSVKKKSEKTLKEKRKEKKEKKSKKGNI
jgi:hypothetical protein